ncbi:sporulation integral membrane protein YtvI [Rossellomorea marisflavi]|nr:sporulation integral membrane protein YtvI [Rossellomorea marisflavi]KMK95708.1 sporulation integral membrane protein YtvI [Rossellomorea marisflavi]KML32179.1 sporulation integral membrane protein YtvI [Rossellomorea marisflavi]QHA38194.1 sporulation integral membrane protein YtvI [Rossellomorea marisflavi]TYO74063.1 sporulation integral membrane protein YtvI [Rossellomorea marisflavi]USK92118.1 sporulation integral membrane protein YtvI [Rossellomorea marisflavi]
MNRVLVKRVIMFVLLLAACVFVYIYFSVFLPIFLALLTAMVMEPLVKWVKKLLKSEKRLLPVIIVFTTFMLVCAWGLYFTVTRVFNSLYEWSLNIPVYAKDIQVFVNDQVIRFNEFIDEVPQGDRIVKEIEKQSQGLTDTAVHLTSQLINAIGSALQSIPNMVFVTLIYLITFFLFSLDLPKLLNMFFNFFKPETSGKLRFVFQKMSKVFMGYWKAQFILSIGVFLITYISLLFISPKVALIMSIIIWLVDIIPLYVGPALVLAPWGLLAMILGDVNGGLALIVLAAVITIVRRAIEPKILGDSIGLAALPTVLTMYFGFVFFGVMGLILGPFVYIAIRSAKEAGLFQLNKG